MNRLPLSPLTEETVRFRRINQADVIAYMTTKGEDLQRDFPHMLEEFRVLWNSQVIRQEQPELVIGKP